MTTTSKLHLNRCNWCLKSISYINYHDKIWGVPIYNDQELFRVLSLEISQAGLSYLTILNKTKDYNVAFNNFNIDNVAKFNTNDIENILANTNIVKNYSKIKAIINNANIIKLLQNNSQSFSNYLWQYVNFKSIRHSYGSIDELPSQDDLSTKLAFDMKKQGFSFVGPVSIHSFLQAVGIYQDHLTSCFKYQKYMDK